MENKNQIKFESLETKIDIGRWLAWIGLIKDKKLLKKFKIKAYHQIEIAEILTKLNIYTQVLDDITNHFSKILNQIGINEPCTIKPYEDYYQNFICHLEKTNEDILIKLTMGGFFDGHTVLRTKKENITKEYKPIVNRETNEIKLKLYQYTINNQEKHNNYTHYIYSESLLFEVENKDNNLSLNIDFNKNIDPDNELPNKDKLEEYFLNLTLPKEIDTLYKEITNILGEDVSKYYIFELSLLKKGYTNENSILLKNGKLENFIITKNNKTIEIDNQDNWSYETTDITATKKDTNISCSINSKSIKELENQNILEHLNVITTEIENTKKLTRTLLKNNSKQKGE